MKIERGDLLDVTTASGAIVRMRAMNVPVQGRDFPVVWVCTEQEWDRATASDEEPDGIPWPLDAVRALAST
ncbi:hypothetical protein [Mycobacterium interjectum]|uniref:hypothetical protein n=1 Tax=Mycobacterium interjectum TaxID=33895 RepID=UPI000829CF41|nr:hypothetical protein [Mycobacterium interjectum]